MPCLLPVMKRNAQNSADLWFTCAQFHPLYLLSRHDVAHVTSHTRPSRFSACNIESWVGPGDEASPPPLISVPVTPPTPPAPPTVLPANPPNVNQFYLKFIKGNIRVCQGCRGSLKTSDGAVPSPPFDLAVILVVI